MDRSGGCGTTIVEMATGARFAVLGDGRPAAGTDCLCFSPAPGVDDAAVVPVCTAGDRPTLAAAQRFWAVTVASVADLAAVGDADPDFYVVHAGELGSRLGAAELAAVVAYAAARSGEVVAVGISDARQHEELRRLGVAYGAGPHVDDRLAPGRASEGEGEGEADRLGRLRARLAVADDAHDVVALVCDHIAGLGLLPSVYVERHGVLRCIAQRGYWQVVDGIPIDLGVLGRTFREGRRQHVDSSSEEEFIEAVPGLAAEITTPLSVGGRVRGVFSVESTRSFTAAEVHEIDRVAAELERAIARTGIEQPTTALHALVRADAELAALTDEEAVAHAAVRLACSVAGTSSAMIAFPSPGGATTVRAAAGPLAPALRRLDPADLRALARDLGGVSSCMAGGDADGRSHPVFDDVRRSGGASLSAFPVRCATADVGLLFAVDQVPGGLGADRREATELLAGTVARTLDHVRVHATLRFRAERDALTMVGNRGAFDEALAALDAPGRRHERVAVVLVDVDRFKQVNDRFGHVVGDQVLVDVARSMLECLRHDDRLFRIGGDEFAILVPGIGEDGAQELAARLRERARSVLDSVDAGITVGSAVREPGEVITDCVIRADGALYAGKSGHAPAWRA